jgi:regulation of enolase protein 1 (concanavalin A-like superfamily)
LKDEKLRIGIPATHHSMNANPGLDSAPRMWKEVEGDFTAIVRVAFPIRTAPDPKGTEVGSLFASAGLVAWQGDGNFIRVVRKDQTLSERPVEAHVRDQCSPRRVTSVITRYKRETGSGHIRLSRQGQIVIAAYSHDDKTWYEIEKVEVDWGSKVKVGVIAENGYKAPFEAVFDQYSLTQPKKK